MEKKHIVFIHLFNNFSGSPNVLATIAKELYKNKYKTTVITSFNNNGFLTDVPANHKININYVFQSNFILRGIQFLKFQILCSFLVLKMPKKNIIYINTILPFLPALVAKIKGQKIIYHIHEAYPNKSIFQKFLFKVANKTAQKIICVSNYVKETLDQTSKSKACVIYNALNEEFSKKKIKKNSNGTKNVLMIASARKYKGIFEFFNLANYLPHFNFTLVCDASPDELTTLFKFSESHPINLKLYGSQNDLHKFYANADIILNLSNPKLIVETFGLTILEGMTYGLPAIIPPVGGITELVENGVNGFQIDVNDTNKLITGLEEILNNEEVYKKMEEAALKKVQMFNVDIQIESIESKILDNL